MAHALRKPEETQSYTERIRDLLAQDRVGAARALLAEALERKDHKEDLSILQQELDPDRTSDVEWLKAHANSYRGEWVALLGGELLAHSANLEEVLSTTRKKHTKHRPLLHFIDHPSEIPGLQEAQTYAEKIRALVEADRVGGARALLAKALEKDDHGEDLSYWQEVLAPAKVIRVGGELEPDRTPEFEWLRAHGREYRGQWVALVENRLLAHSSNLDEVLSTVKGMETSRRPLLHHLD